MSPNLAFSLLFVPALVDKNIGALVLPGQSLMVYPEDYLKIPGYVHRKSDGFFIDDHDNTRAANFDISDENEVNSIMAIARTSIAPHQKKTNLRKSKGRQATVRPSCVEKKKKRTKEIAL